MLLLACEGRYVTAPALDRFGSEVGSADEPHQQCTSDEGRLTTNLVQTIPGCCILTLLTPFLSLGSLVFTARGENEKIYG